MKEHYAIIGLWRANSRIGYKDEEGDLVRVDSQMEWEAMLLVFQKEKVIKIYVVSSAPSVGPSPYVGSSPCGPVPPSCCNNGVKGSAPSSSSVPPGCGCGGSRPFPFMFPHHQMNGGANTAVLSQFLHSFLKENLGNLSKFLPNGLPEGMPGRFVYHFLQREGLQFLHRKDFQNARSVFAALCELKPEDAIGHYNLACAESLLGNVPESFGALVKSIDLGYNDLEHVLSDSDLENLKVNAPSLFDEVCGILLKKEGKGEGKETEDITEPQRKSHVEVVPPVVSEPKKSEQPPKPAEIPPPVVEILPVHIPSQVSPTPTESKWAKELFILQELGFLSSPILIELLNETEGSIQRTIELLL